MIVSRTPVRMSFVGGGSDIKGFYSRKKGAVISTAIDKYIYVTVNKKFDDAVRVAYSINEEVENAGLIQHPIVNTALNFLGIIKGIEITTVADIPSTGTGLGSSSTFTVGLLNALSCYAGTTRDKSWLAEKSCHIEIDLCGGPIGKQDQYAAAFGGLNFIEFHEDGTVSVESLNLEADILQSFEDNVLMFYTGVTRSASQLLERQSIAMAENTDTFNAVSDMVDHAYTMKKLLQNGSLEEVGLLLNEGWLLKKSLMDGISSTGFDDLYDRGIKSGALGGKILGAGGGGFLMFYAPSEKHGYICQELNELRQVKIGFDTMGSRIVMNQSEAF